MKQLNQVSQSVRPSKKFSRFIVACRGLLWLLAVVALVVGSPEGLAQSNASGGKVPQLDLPGVPGNNGPALQAERPVFSATVKKSLWLPPEMYGQWNITATLLESNDPDYFAPVLTELWVLERTADQVIIRNAANGASAAINVQAVQGNTATFEHQVFNPTAPFVLTERPTVTVQGDSLSGITVNQVVKVGRSGRVEKQWWAKYQIQANRISEGRVQFGEAPSSDELEFEIAPVESDSP